MVQATQTMDRKGMSVGSQMPYPERSPRTQARRAYCHDR